MKKNKNGSWYLVCLKVLLWILYCLFSTSTHRHNAVCRHTKCWRPMKIRKTIKNRNTYPVRKHDAFHPFLHTRRRRTKDESICKLQTGLTTASEFPLFPQLTNSWLLTTDYQYSGYYILAVWSAVRVMTRRHAVKKEPSNQKPPKRIGMNDDHHVSRQKVHTQRYHVPENWGGSFPMKGIQHSHTTKSIDVCSQQVTLCQWWETGQRQLVYK